LGIGLLFLEFRCVNSQQSNKTFIDKSKSVPIIDISEFAAICSFVCRAIERPLCVIVVLMLIFCERRRGPRSSLLPSALLRHSAKFYVILRKSRAFNLVA
jgi:hypothetical protein